MKCQDLDITRSKKPNRLVVISQGKEYHDEEGQSLVNLAYGSHELWVLTSYQKQKKSNTLLTGTNKEKLKLLQQLSFHEEDIGVYSHHLDSYISATEKDILLLEHDIKSRTQDKMVFLKKHGTVDCQTMSAGEESQLKVRIANLKKQLEQWREESSRQDKLQGQLSSLQKQKEKLQRTFPVLEEPADPIPLRRDLEQLRMQLEECRSKLSRQEERKGLQRQKELLVSQLESVQSLFPFSEVPLSREEVGKWHPRLADLKRTETLYNNYSLLTQDINLTYDPTLSKQVSSLQEQLRIQDLLRSRDFLLKELAQLPKEIDCSSLGQQQESLRNLQLCRNTVLCPGCSVSLNVQLNPLQLGLSSVQFQENLEEKISQIQLGIHAMQEASRVEKKRQVLQDKLNSMVIPDGPDSLGSKMLSTPEYNNLKRRCDKSCKLTYIDPPLYPSVVVQSCHDWHTLSSELASIQKQLDTYPPVEEVSLDPQKLLKEIATLKQHILSVEEQRRVYDDNTKRIKENKEQLLSCQQEEEELLKLVDPSLPGKIRDAVIVRDRREQELNHGRIANELQELNNALGQLDRDLSVSRDRLLKMGRLNSLLHKAKCRMLNTVIQNINASLNTVCSSIFEEPIVVELRLHRELKSKKGKEKQEVNILIHHKGADYDISQVSGGEMDRISLAVTLALFNVSPSPILMLDESMGSLPSQLRQWCCAAINKTVDGIAVCVDHESVEGYYTDTIQL